MTPLIAFLPFMDGYQPKLAAFVIFLIAAISDFLDGWLARDRGEITDLGKILDPLADKLLLFATLIPIYFITRETLVAYQVPWWGVFPMWVVVLLVGREVFMTLFRQYASRKGVVIAALGAGKLKTIFQDIFLGGMIAWFAWIDMRENFGWDSGWLGDAWETVLGAAIAVTLAVSVVLTVYSLAVYLYKYRGLLNPVGTGTGSPNGS